MSTGEKAFIYISYNLEIKEREYTHCQLFKETSDKNWIPEEHKWGAGEGVGNVIV